MKISHFIQASVAGALRVNVTVLIAMAVAAAQTPSVPVPSSFFGMHLIQASNWPATAPTYSLGKGSGVSWPFIERSQGSFDWSRLDQYVNSAANHGISFMFSNQGVPPWAASNTSTCKPTYYSSYICTSGVSNIQYWKNFVTALLARYKGRIKVYELWNEPQNGFTGTVAELVALTQAEHDIIRAYDPSAQIFSPSTISYGYPYLDSYFAAGGTKDVDGIAMHGYPNPNNDVPEFIMGSITSGMRTVMNKYGLGSKPLWNSESSWGSTAAGAITNADLQAAFIARNFLLHWSQGITRVYWYAYDNDTIGSLWTATSGLNQAGIALEQVYKWMQGATMSPCSLNGSTDFYHALYTCDMNRSGGYSARAVWSTNGITVYTAPSQFTQYRDLSGATHSMPSNHQVSIGLKPILLESLTGAATAQVFQTESLPVQTSGALNTVASSSLFTNGLGTMFDAVAVGNSVTYTISVPSAGTYDVRVAMLKNYIRGTWQASINGTNKGSAQSEYAPSAVWAEVDLGTVTLSAGNTSVKFTVTGKDASSTGYRLAFDYIKLTAQ